MFAKDETADAIGGEADRLKESQFAAAFENVAQDDHAKTEAAEEQAEPAEDLECADVRVLHG